MADRPPWSTAMLEFLRRDHQRHLVRKVIAVGAQHVPPVLALDKLERDRQWHARKKGTSMDDSRLEDRETRVRKGQFSVAADALGNHVRKGHVDRNGDHVWIPRRRVVPWLEAMLSLLDDGQWHPRRDVIAAGAAEVPPVRALKELETRRKWQAKKSGLDLNDAKLVDRETRVRSGQWRVATSALSMAIRRELVRATDDCVQKRRSR